MNNSKKSDEKAVIHELYNCLCERTEEPIELLDIKDVLLQAYKRIDNEKNPEVLINRLVQYIHSMSLKGKLRYSSKEEELIIQLGMFQRKTGLNGIYRGDTSDKSQFYKYTETIPRHK